MGLRESSKYPTQFRTRGRCFAQTLWQRSEGSKLRRSDWMHCLTYLDNSNSNQQHKSHAKQDAKYQWQGRQARTTSADTMFSHRFNRLRTRDWKRDHVSA